MCSVLVIDDDSAVREIIRHTLAGEGFSVLTAPDGRSGLDLFEAGSIDVVVTDVKMPYMDGTEVLTHIRHSDRPNTPVVGISGTPRLLTRAGFDRQFVKPFSMGVLVAAVRSLCSVSEFLLSA
ncbi:MAG: response regulator [Desulfobacterales bacterium]|jgi:DNA-binding response OmpR family regulator